MLNRVTRTLAFRVSVEHWNRAKVFVTQLSTEKTLPFWSRQHYKYIFMLSSKLPSYIKSLLYVMYAFISDKLSTIYIIRVIRVYMYINLLYIFCNMYTLYVDVYNNDI